MLLGEITKCNNILIVTSNLPHCYNNHLKICIGRFRGDGSFFLTFFSVGDVLSYVTCKNSERSVGILPSSDGCDLKLPTNFGSTFLLCAVAAIKRPTRRGLRPFFFKYYVSSIVRKDGETFNRRANACRFFSIHFSSAISAELLLSHHLIVENNNFPSRIFKQFFQSTATT